MASLFRASSFGRPAADIYASQILGHRIEQTDSMIRGLLAEQLLREPEDQLIAKYKVLPPVLEGTGFKRWAEYDKHHGIDRKNDKLVTSQTWSEAVRASHCLRHALGAMNLDPMEAEYQGSYDLQLFPNKPLVYNLTCHNVTCTTDFVWKERSIVIDTKVMSKPIDSDYADAYAWQLAIQKQATQCMDAHLLVAVQYGDKFVAQLVKPLLYTLGDIQARSVSLANEIQSIHSLN